MIVIGTASITPRLERCLVTAVLRTADLPYRIIVDRGAGTHGAKLDRILKELPAATTWFCTFDDDAAPMQYGWMSWLLAQIGPLQWGGFWHTRSGTPHPMGAMYRVSWLRDSGASFEPDMPRYDVGEGFGIGEPAFIATPAARSVRPWWLSRADVAIDSDGYIVYAHIGGGTIGHTSPRIPNILWPWCVQRFINRSDSSRRSRLRRWSRGR